MLLPQIAAKSDNVTMVNSFLGLNRNNTISEQEFADMNNVNNDHFPIITNRKKRGIINTLDKCQGFIGGKCIAYVNDNKLYYDQSLVCTLPLSNVDRKLVYMGAYLVVFPDGIVYNTFTKETPFSISNTTSATGVTFTLSRLDGTAYTSSNTSVGDTEPASTYKYWIDTSQDPVVMKMRSNNVWTSVATSYVKVSGTNIGKGFKKYDAVTFSGVDKGSWIYNDYDFNTSNVIYDCGDDYLIIAGFINMTHTNSTEITFKRELPVMDYVCEMENRIWGCNSDKHEIYACKLGDPTNWNFFGGLDSDSYAATVGTQNVFTGAISYGGYAFFFKEDGYHKVYGSKPSNFEISWYPGRGVQQDSDKSLCVVGTQLFFKARDGVCVYDGSIEPISAALGSEPMYNAVAGCYRDKYYISMCDANRNYKLYVYDTSKGTWVIEGNTKCNFFGYSNNGLYMLDKNGVLYNINNEAIYTKVYPANHISNEYDYPSNNFKPGNVISGNLEKNIEWFIETGDIGMNTPFHKYIKKLWLRVFLDVNAKMKIEIMYDSSDEWLPVMEYYATRKRTYEVPLQVQRCDHMRIRLSGFGDFKLFSIAKSQEEGSGI